jgi:hypothetical protein
MIAFALSLFDDCAFEILSHVPYADSEAKEEQADHWKCQSRYRLNREERCGASVEELLD